MVVVSLLSVATVRLTGNGPDQRRAALGEPSAPVERPLRFEDRANGAVAVIDPRTGEKVAAFEGEQGFVRGALRALARHRKARGIGSEEPFELQVKPDGALTLLDPATGAESTDLVEARVPMRAYTEAEIDAYVATGDPLDKAGAYGIQERAAGFIHRFEGSYSGVMGLPLVETAKLLASV